MNVGFTNPNFNLRDWLSSLLTCWLQHLLSFYTCHKLCGLCSLISMLIGETLMLSIYLYKNVL